MSREEAEEIWGMIAVVYGIHPERRGDNAPVWVSALMPFDVSDTMTLVDAYLKGRGPEKLPTVVAFVKEIRTLVERRKDDAARMPLALDEGRKHPRPLWVVAWELARADGVDAAFPETEGGAFQLGYQWPPDTGIINGREHAGYLKKAKPLWEVEVSPPAPVEPDPTCMVCLDAGWVEVGRDSMLVGAEGEKRMMQYAETAAPCPACGLGKLIEHPMERRGIWGDEGFWRGQKWAPIRAGVVEILP